MVQDGLRIEDLPKIRYKAGHILGPVNFFAWLGVFFRSRTDLGLEILALRKQVSVLKVKHPRPRLRRFDRIFWVVLRHIGSRWSQVLFVVKTVVSWHRAGFRLSWRVVSRHTQRGRPKIEDEVRKLIQSHAGGESFQPLLVLQITVSFLKVSGAELATMRERIAKVGGWNPLQFGDIATRLVGKL